MLKSSGVLGNFASEDTNHEPPENHTTLERAVNTTSKTDVKEDENATDQMQEAQPGNANTSVIFVAGR
jgi:hypothetical protein